MQIHNPLRIVRVWLGVACGSIALCTGASAATIIPSYSLFASDVTATPIGGGDFTIPLTAEVYEQEIWERPFQDNEWSDDTNTGLRTSTGLYYGYNDISSAAMGWNSDYLFASITVVGGFVQDNNNIDSGVGLKGTYYVYFSTDPNGAGGYLLELQSGTAAGSSFASGDALVYFDANGDVGGPGGLTVTEEGGSTDGFNTSLGPNGLYVREINGDTIEFALDLSGFNDLNPTYFDNLQFVRFGVATSNPSAPSDILANDEFREAQGVGVEYDTTLIGFPIPEPSVPLVAGLGILGLFLRRTRRA